MSSTAARTSAWPVTLPPNATAGEYLKDLEDGTAVQLLPTLVLLGLLSLVGNAGNGVTLYVYYTRFKPSSTRTYILAMSAFDILFDTFSLPGEIIDLRFSMTYRARWLCRLHRLITGFLTVVSACILVAVALDRRRKICQPFQPPSSARKVTLTLVACSSVAFALAVPFSIMNGTHSVETDIPGVVGSACSVDDSFLDTVFPLVMNALFLLVFLSSVVIMITSYVQIGKKVVRHKKKLASQTDQFPGGGTVAALAMALTQLDSAGHSAENEDSAALCSKDSKESPILRESTSKADVESLPRASHSDDVRRGGAGSGNKTGAAPVKPLGIRVLPAARKGQLPALKTLKLEMSRGGSKHVAGGGGGGEDDDDLRDDVFATPTPTAHSPGFQPKFGSIGRSDSRGTRKANDEFEMAFKTLAHTVSENTIRAHSDPGQQDGGRPQGLARCRSASVGDELFHVRYIAEFVHRNSRASSSQTASGNVGPPANKKATHGDLTEPTEASSYANADDDALVKLLPSESSDLGGNSSLDVREHAASSDPKRRSRSLPGDPTAKISRGGSAKGRPPPGRPKAKSTSSAPSHHEGLFRSFVRTTLRRAMTLNSEREESSGLEPVGTSTLSRRRRTVRKIPSRTTWMMFVLTAIFVISYLPYLSLVIVRAIHHDIETGLSGWKLNAYTIGLKCYFINSVVNPIVYSFCSARFRHQCRYIFRSKRKFSVSG